MCSALFCSMSYGQSGPMQYKSFNDTSFVIGDKILASRISFNFNGNNEVIPEYYDSVKVIADFLNRNPKLRIEIGAHTDCRGNDTDNVKLSEYRATSVFDLLVRRYGTDGKRIEVKGYGESAPLIAENEIRKCEDYNKKEEMHAINRRVEIKIIEK